MSATDRAENVRLGFLTAVESRDRSFVGGMLVTDRFGRPLEFQCTTPVKPNRTQELLYGPTLVPFILGELLGKTLVEKLSVKPSLVFVDRAELLPLRTCTSMPVLCLVGKAQKEFANHPLVEIGRHTFALHRDFETDQEALKKLKTVIAAEADVSEPLERVSEALKETMASVGGGVKAAS